MEMRLPLPGEGFRDQTKSRLNSYRHVDLIHSNGSSSSSPARPDIMTVSLTQSHSHSPSSSALTKLVPTKLPLSPKQNTITTTTTTTPNSPPSSPHARNHSTSIIATSHDSQKFRPTPRPKTFSDFSSIESALNTHPVQTPAAGNIPASRRKVPASNSRNDSGLDGPPPAMITQRSFPFEADNTPTTTTTTQTQDWVASVAQEQPPPTPAKSSRSSTGSTQLRPLILPIRAFKSSTRRSLDIASKRNSNSMDPDSTIRALEGFEEHRPTNQTDQEEHNSDESDLFLRAAREEELAQRANPQSDRLIRSDKRRVRYPSFLWHTTIFKLHNILRP